MKKWKRNGPLTHYVSVEADGKISRFGPEYEDRRTYTLDMLEKSGGARLWFIGRHHSRKENPYFAITKGLTKFYPSLDAAIAAVKMRL